MTFPCLFSGLAIEPLVLGGNVFGWDAAKHTCFAVLGASVAGGGNAIDTADAYSAWAATGAVAAARTRRKPRRFFGLGPADELLRFFQLSYVDVPSALGQHGPVRDKTRWVSE